MYKRDWHQQYYQDNKTKITERQQERRDINDPKLRFAENKSSSKRRYIEWNLTFDEWWKIWQDSGHWEERGRQGYHLCRKGDIGNYSLNNCYIAHYTINGRQNVYNTSLKLIFPVLCDCCKEKVIDIIENI